MSFLLILLAAFVFSADGPAQSLKVGDKAPDIVMATPEGKEIKLSSLQGQMVLIDFWASWCRPCRKENPEIVKTYHEYKDTEFKNGKGFTVFSVSLDNKDVAWTKAIEADKLTWEHHVSDLKGWNNEAARKYEVRSIPQSYLIDGDGVIVAINPRGSELEKQLKRHLKKKSFFNFWSLQSILF